VDRVRCLLLLAKRSGGHPGMPRESTQSLND